MKALTVNVALRVAGEEEFVLLLKELIEHKKNVAFLPDRSIWDYDPDTTFLSATVMDVD